MQATYRDSERAERPGLFNLPGILLTDAVIFESGVHVASSETAACGARNIFKAGAFQIPLEHEAFAR